MTDTPKRDTADDGHDSAASKPLDSSGGGDATGDSPSTDSRTTVTELRQIVRAFVAERSWEKFHNAKNLSMSIAIEAAELMEHFQWLTTDETVAGEQQDRSAITDELADVTCYVLALANVLGVDLTDAVTNKMVKNRIKYPVERA